MTRRRRFRRRLFWAGVIAAVLLLALGATVAQAVVALGEAASRLERRLGRAVEGPVPRRSARSGSR